MRLILLPGLDGTGELFSEFIKNLSKNMTATCISYPEQERLSYSELVEHVRCRLPTNEDFVILAESFSGPIAFKLAQAEPKHLQAIVFVASFLRNPNRVFMRLMRLLPLSIILRYSPPDFVVRKWMLGDEASHEMVLKFKSILRRLPIKTIKFRLQEIYKLSLVEFMLNYPVYYIKPLQDRLVTDDNYIDFVNTCPNIELFTLDGPHFILQSNAESCANYVNQRMNQISGKN